MKSFFKKLSFVLAAAMIITLIPAQAAKAEGVIKLALQNAASVSDAISYDTLKVGEKQDYKFYGCLDYKTTGLGWVSSNEAVATVDKSGVVTAVAAGVAQISYEAKGYTTEAITLLVADEYDVNIADQDSKEIFTSKTFTKIGDTQDFCFVGAKGYSLSTHKCTWFSTDANVAKVNNVGLVEAVGEGTAKIVLTIVDKATGAVAFSVAPLDVTVAVSKFAAKQTAYNAAEVTFGDDAAKGVQAFSLEKETGERLPEYIDVNGKVVTFFNGLENGTTYVFVDENGNEAQFVANTGKVADFTVTYSSMLGKKEETGKAYVPGDVTIKLTDLIDENGIKVKTTGYDVEFVDKFDGAEYYNYDGKLFIAEKGDVHEVTVNLKNAETGEVLSKNVTITGVAQPALTILKDSVAVRVGKADSDRNGVYNDPQAFADCGSKYELSISDDAVYGLALSLQDSQNTYKDGYQFDAGQVMTGQNADADGVLRELGQFVFESSNYDVLGVTDSGILEARAQGTATIFVYFEYVDYDTATSSKTLLKTASFKVVDAIYPAEVTLTKSSSPMFANGNYARLADVPGACGFNTATFEYTVKDQLGRKIDQLNVTTDNGLAVPAGTKVLVTAADIADATKKSVTNNIKVTFEANGKKVTRTISVVVFNIEEIEPARIPGVVLCSLDTTAGLGNTDNYKADANTDITIGVHIVKVHVLNGAYVYGEDWTNDETKILNYNVLSNLKTSQELADQENANRDAFYAAVYIGNTLVKTDFTSATSAVQLVQNGTNPVGDPHDFTTPGKYLQIKIRDAFNNLVGDDLAKDDLNKDGVIDVLDKAIALSKILEKKVRVDLYDLYNTNTMESTQVSATWRKGQASKYDSVGELVFKNNDVANYAVALSISDYTYEGDIPASENDWADWFQTHATLKAKVWGNTGNGIQADKASKAYSFVDAYNEANNDPYTLYDFKISTMTNNSKYIQSAGMFFGLRGTGTATAPTIVTYIPEKVGKKITQYDYNYKNEFEGRDGEGGVIIP